MPERTGLSQSFGGMAAALVGTAKYYLWLESGGLTPFRTGVISLEIILGCLTATGGLMAAGKLADWIPSKSITYPFQNIVNVSLLIVAMLLGVYLVFNPTASWAVPVIIALALGACSSTRTQESAGEVIDDSVLTSKVKVALIDDPVTKAGQINVETKGGLHIHHMVWGILLLLSMGYIGITIENDSPWAELVSIAFGMMRS